MLDTLKELIMSIMPALTSIVATCVGVITFYNKVRQGQTNNDSIVRELKAELYAQREENKRLINTCLNNQQAIINNQNDIEQRNKLLIEQNKALQEQNDELKEEVKNLSTVKNQLKELLRDKGE